MSIQKSDIRVKKELVCPYCQHQVGDLDRHFNRSFTDGETLSCSDCELFIVNELCLLNHRKNVHHDATKVFSCETCKIDFSSKKIFVYPSKT